LKIYIIGSLANPDLPALGHFIRLAGFEVFDQWWAASDDADLIWKQYAQARGQTYREALNDHAAQHVFEFDKSHLDSSDAGVLVMPAGKSGWAEMGYLSGQGKTVFIYFPEDPAADKWDVMALFATGGVHYDKDELLDAIQESLHGLKEG